MLTIDVMLPIQLWSINDVWLQHLLIRQSLLTPWPTPELVRNKAHGQSEIAGERTHIVDHTHPHLSISLSIISVRLRQLPCDLLDHDPDKVVSLFAANVYGGFRTVNEDDVDVESRHPSPDIKGRHILSQGKALRRSEGGRVSEDPPERHGWRRRC